MEGQMEVQEIFAILHKWGIHTLGQLARLDKEQLCARLGPEAIRMWERANGQSNRVLKLVRPPESFEESFEFEHEIETAEPLLFMLRRFLEQLAVRLGAIYLVAKELTLQITFGNERVGTPVIEETHRPDAFRMEPFSWSSNNPSFSPSPPHGEKGSPLPLSRWERRMRSASEGEGVGLGEGRVRGLLATLQRVAFRRFRPAVSASLLLDEDTLAHVRSAEISGKVINQRGPYLISGNWWDEKAWARAEWDLQIDNGVVVRCHQGEAQWEIDGIYD